MRTTACFRFAQIESKFNIENDNHVIIVCFFCVCVVHNDRFDGSAFDSIHIWRRKKLPFLLCHFFCIRLGHISSPRYSDFASKYAPFIRNKFCCRQLQRADSTKLKSNLLKWATQDRQPALPNRKRNLLTCYVSFSICSIFKKKV